MIQKVVVVIFSIMWLFPAMFNSQGTRSVPVLDTDGNPVVLSSHYYIKPAFPYSGSGLTLVTRNTDEGGTCPPNVGQLKDPDFSGIPVNFTSTESTEEIKEGGNLVITFQSSTSDCPELPVWSMDQMADSLDRRFRISAGFVYLPNSLFRIFNNNGQYYFYWCSHTGPYDNDCGREFIAGIMSENGVYVLALDGIPLPFKFEKVYYDSKPF